MRTARRYAADGTWVEISPEAALDEAASASSAAADGGVSADEGFVWIGVTTPDRDGFDEIAQALSIHALIADDVFGARRQPKVQWLDEHLLTIAWRLIDHGDEGIEVGEVDIIARPGVLLTVSPSSELAALEAAFAASDVSMRGGSLAGVHAILSDIIEGYARVGSRIETELEDLEDLVFDSTRVDDAASIYRLRRQIGKVDRAVSTLHAGLAENRDYLLERFGAARSDELLPYVYDLVADLAAVDHLTDQQNDALSAVISGHENSVATQQNDDARKISAFAALIAIPAVVSGVYGMNFTDLPLTQFAWGWVVIVGIILLLEVWAYAELHRRDWL